MQEEISLDDHGNERNDSWVVEINDEVSKMQSIPETKPSRKPICRMPINVQEEKDKFLYTPRIISFGPYHRDNKLCKQTHEYKKCALIHFLKRSSKEVIDYYNALREVVQDLKDAYDELDPRWQQDDDAFLQLMIYDGCCFIEILHEVDEILDKERRIGHLSRQILTMYRISVEELMEYYKYDMLLLENQLPMQLLAKLVSIQKDLQMEAATKELQFRILRFVCPTSFSYTEGDLPEWESQHVLHLYYCNRVGFKKSKDSISGRIETPVESFRDAMNELQELCPTRHMLIFMAIPMSIGFIFGMTLVLMGVILGIIILPLFLIKDLFGIKPPKNIYFIIPSATELVKVGIGIKTTGTENPQDIAFGSRTLRLPEIYVDVATKSRFLNIIAFEKLYWYDEKDVTAYIYFMSRLIQDGNDVRLLQLRGIIHTLLHKDQVVELFKSLTKDIVHAPWQQHPEKTVSSPSYHDVGKSLTKSFYSKMNNPWQQDLWQTYLKSPWTVISIIAAFFLFTLASLQTVYTILSYYHPK